MVCAALEAAEALSAPLNAASGAAEMLAVMHRVGANAIAIHDEGGGGGGGRGDGEDGDPELSAWALFPALSMINHSCEPNCEWAFGNAGGRATVRVRTVATVEAGEELTVSYLPPQLLEPSRDQERRGELRGGFGFVCACRRCATSGGS